MKVHIGILALFVLLSMPVAKAQSPSEAAPPATAAAESPTAADFAVRSAGTKWTYTYAGGKITQETRVTSNAAGRAQVVTTMRLPSQEMQGPAKAWLLGGASGADWMEQWPGKKAALILPATLETGSKWTVTTVSDLTGKPWDTVYTIIAVDAEVKLPNGKAYTDVLQVKMDQGGGLVSMEYYKAGIGHLGTFMPSDNDWVLSLSDFAPGK
jgi:hypothetical protein